MYNHKKPHIRQLIFDKYNGRCAYCGVKLTQKTFNVDHLIPKRRFDTSLPHGTDKTENLNPSCFSCNASKNSLELDMWKEEITKKYDRLLRDCSRFRLLVRFGLIRKVNKPFKFYFEKHG